MSSPKERIAILTGGGNAPGLNAVISGATQILKEDGHTVVGIPEGWNGLLVANHPKIRDLSAMNRHDLQQLLGEPGTILGSSRTRISTEQYPTVKNLAARYGLTGLIAVGGDDTLGQAREMHQAGVLPINGVPKTIDNDVANTEKTFGFDTAVNEAMVQIERMRVEAKTMNRVSVVEIMGRNAGWITLHAGFAAGADMTLIPEFPIPEDRLIAVIRECFERQGHVVIALSEGFSEADERDSFGNGKKRGAAEKLAALIKQKTGYGTQEQIVGYMCRNGPPNAQDRIFAAQMGARAGMLSALGDFGNLMSMQQGRITHVPLEQMKGGRLVTEAFYDVETLSMRLLPLL